MMLDGGRISSAWLGTCLDLVDIATANSTTGNDGTLCLSTSGNNVRRTCRSMEHLHSIIDSKKTGTIISL